MLNKIISGGQTGADRAALDVAIKFGFDHGGWIPKGRLTEDGPLPERYHLVETGSVQYPVRTRKNIQDSDGTLIISRGRLSGGSLLTRTLAIELKKPFCHIDLLLSEDFEGALAVNAFIQDNDIRTLNVAGPRSSQQPGIYQDVKTILEAVLYLLFLDRAESELRCLGLDFPHQDIPYEAPPDDEDLTTVLVNTLTLRQKTAIARLDSHMMWALYFAMLDYVVVRSGLDRNDRAMHRILSDMPDSEFCHAEDMAMVLIKKIKTVLEKEYVLKVVK